MLFISIYCTFTHSNIFQKVVFSDFFVLFIIVIRQKRVKKGSFNLYLYNEKRVLKIQHPENPGTYSLGFFNLTN